MSNASFPIQEAVFTRLRGFAGLTALLASSVIDGDTANKAVYDAMPQPSAGEAEAQFPFVVIGDETGVPWDTDLTAGAESTITLHTWSRYRGKKETKQIQAQLHAALHDHALAVTGHQTVLCLWEFGEVFDDPDGLTRHGVDRFRIITVDT